MQNLNPNEDPEDIVRNLELRRDLDKIKAESKIDSNEGNGYSAWFSEQIRSDLERVLLSISDPEKFNQLLILEDRLWEETWKKLSNEKVDNLTLSIDNKDYLSRRLSLRSLDQERFEERLACTDQVSVPAIQLLIGSPFDENKYFEAFKVTTAKTYLNWHNRLSDPELVAKHADKELTAFGVIQDNIPKIVGRYLIVPSEDALNSQKKLEELSRQFIQEKTSQEFLQSCSIRLFDADEEARQKRAKTPWLERIAGDALNLVMYPFFRLMISLESRENSNKFSPDLLKLESQLYPLYHSLPAELLTKHANPPMWNHDALRVKYLE